jgi:hypothetical protein
MVLPRAAAADVADTGGVRGRDPRAHGLARTFLLQAALAALGIVLGSAAVAAQSPPPDQVAQPDAARPVPPSSAEVARSTLDAEQRALLELQQLQLRENELSQVRQRYSLAGPATGLGLGLAGAVTMIPFGSVFLAVAEPTDDSEMPGYEGSESGDPLRMMGGLLLGLGAVALITAVICGMHVRRLRPQRRAADEELRAIRLRRIDTVEASSSHAPAPAAVARAALEADSTIRALGQLQRRESEALNVRSQSSLAWPAVGLGVGSLLTPILIPLGSVLLATADQNYEYTYSNGATEITSDNRDRSRRAGSILLPLGLTALATVIYCGVLVRRRRHAKRYADQELLTVRAERTRILDALTVPADTRTPVH